MIRFDCVAKRYTPRYTPRDTSGIDALSALSFEVPAGDMLIVSGHSGAGNRH